MYIIYHDPGCLYSIACLAVLKSRRVSFKKINFLKEPLTLEMLKGLVTKLKIRPINLICTDNKDWENHYAHLNLTDEEIYHLLLQKSKFLISPIIVNGDKAVIGRPPKNLIKMIDNQSSSSI